MNDIVITCMVLFVYPSFVKQMENSRRQYMYNFVSVSLPPPPFSDPEVIDF